MTKFTKGDKVAIIGMRSGITAYIERANVHSCGAKVLRIEKLNGQTARFAYNPNADDRIGYSWSEMAVVADGADAELEAKATELAKAYFNREVESAKARIGNAAINQDAIREKIEQFEDVAPIITWK